MKCGFWPEMWKVFIDEAKLKWCVYLTIVDTFLNHGRAKQGVIGDIVKQILQWFQ
jgi:hypothetical protein